MKSNIPFCILVAFSILFGFGKLSAQPSDCEFQLKKIIQWYNMAYYDSIPGACLGNDCMKEKTISENWWVYLASAYYEMDELERAEITLHQLFRRFKRYKPDQTQLPNRFYEEIKRYEYSPVVSIGATLGISSPFFKVHKQFSDINIQSTEDRYIPVYSFQVGLKALYHINSKNSLHLEATNYKLSYRREITYVDFRKFTLEESISEIKIPMFYDRRFPLSEIWSFHLQLGVNFGFNRQSFLSEYINEFIPGYVAHLEITQTIPDSSGTFTSRSKKLNMLHNTFHFGLSSGAAISLDYAGFTMYAHLGYNHELTLLNDRDQRASILVDDLYFIADDISMILPTFNLGFHFPIIYQFKKNK